MFTSAISHMSSVGGGHEKRTVTTMSGEELKGCFILKHLLLLRQRGNILTLYVHLIGTLRSHPGSAPTFNGLFGSFSVPPRVPL